MVLTDLICTQVPEIDIFSIDTGLNARLRCCEIRKIEPFRRAIAL